MPLEISLLSLSNLYLKCYNFWCLMLPKKKKKLQLTYDCCFSTSARCRENHSCECHIRMWASRWLTRYPLDKHGYCFRRKILGRIHYYNSSCIANLTFISGVSGNPLNWAFFYSNLTWFGKMMIFKFEVSALILRYFSVCVFIYICMCDICDNFAATLWCC
jgi:hypothetical protein